MKNKKLKVEDLLRKYNLMDNKIYLINYHFNILKCDLEDFLLKLKIRKLVEFSNNTTEEELANIIHSLILKCDYDSPEYNEKIDIEITRIGLIIEKSHRISNDVKRPSKNYEEDEEDYNVVDLYDDYIDYKNDITHKSKR